MASQVHPSLTVSLSEMIPITVRSPGSSSCDYEMGQYKVTISMVSWCHTRGISTLNGQYIGNLTRRDHSGLGNCPWFSQFPISKSSEVPQNAGISRIEIRSITLYQCPAQTLHLYAFVRIYMMLHPCLPHMFSILTIFRRLFGGFRYIILHDKNYLAGGLAHFLFFHTSGGAKYMLLESLTKHPFRWTADHISKSISCGRCGTVNYHPLFKIYKIKSFWRVEIRPGYDKAPC